MVELAGILVLGIFAQWLAWRAKIPAILPLILIGLILGPISTFFTEGGHKFLESDEIFNGEILFSFVSLSVGVILFEGGLTLRLSEIKQQAQVVWRVLTLGVLVTLIGGTFAAYYFLGLNLRIAFLFGALIIVSGPTVVMPILRNVRANARVNAILKWEGILIDPLGALIAVLAYEFVLTSKTQGEFTLMALKEFFLTMATGSFMGVLGAIFLYYTVKRNWVPEYLRNVTALAVVVSLFAASESVMTESGLLTTTIMGMVLANLKVEELKNIITFKEDISVILISVLFVLLSSRIEIAEINRLGLPSLWLFIFLLVVVRPLGIFLSTLKSDLNWREKVFISWVGPKGIVAAAVASLFSLELAENNNLSEVESEDAAMLLPLVFMVITGTVVLQGATAKLLAKVLKVQAKERNGVLFIGANEAARYIARILYENGIPVVLADTSKANIGEAERMDLPTHEGNIMKDNLWEALDMSTLGSVFAFTPSTEVNIFARKRFMEDFGTKNIYRLISKREMDTDMAERSKNLLFGGKVDYTGISTLIQQNEELSEFEFNNKAMLDEFLQANPHVIPFYVNTPEDKKIFLIANYPEQSRLTGKLLYFKGKEEINEIGDMNTEDDLSSSEKSK
jgi:NhaP-type Na+/H+ or K+/H+ antiporter